MPVPTDVQRRLKWSTLRLDEFDADVHENEEIAASYVVTSILPKVVHARDFKEVIASDALDQQGHDNITLVVRLGEVTPIVNHGKSSVVLVSYLFHYL